MKYIFCFAMIFLISCNGEPFTAPATPQTVWTDSQTHGDTIITNVNNNATLLYYAEKNWQQSADTNLTHGYRFIAIRFGDSVEVKPVGDSTTIYAGPLLLATNKTNDTLKAQNFIDTSGSNAARVFVLLK